ncbi:hypothetical protein AMTR_s00039p00176120 [Amborella trichopoda]|uniref:Uncharacterized protein n=1 Tax=Amborella trichopoda TaxID=13333 RepID=U5D354_AMBTC|nr:hypothetical protein AMTR_s00039p00176120 [Amborella trichopoda]
MEAKHPDSPSINGSTSGFTTGFRPASIVVGERELFGFKICRDSVRNHGLLRCCLQLLYLRPRQSLGFSHGQITSKSMQESVEEKEAREKGQEGCAYT